MLGGPLFQLLRKAHLEGGALDLMKRRILVISLFAWLPLLLLSLLEGRASGGSVVVPFLQDIELHVRLLVALPLLIVAELAVHLRMRPVVDQFLGRGLVPAHARPRFDAAIAAAIRLRNSVTAELVLIAIVYVVGIGLFWRTQVALGVTTWYGDSVDGKLHPSLAGWWLGLVSLPLFQFLLLRWYFRIVIWARFLWHVSRIRLNLQPTHPDRAGGLGFLSQLSFAFSPLLVSQGALIAGLAADRIFFANAKLVDFGPLIAALIGFMVLAILGPMLVFAAQMADCKRTGMREFGELAQRYATEFDRKWLRGGAPAGETLLGSPDIQSLADLGTSYEVVREMRVTPFTLRTALELAIATAVPLLPLTLTIFSAQELLATLLKVIF